MGSRTMFRNIFFDLYYYLLLYASIFFLTYNFNESLESFHFIKQKYLIVIQ